MSMSSRIRKMMTLMCMVVGLVLMVMGAVSFGQEKKEGWANVPGGTVWLEPGRQAYEHDTGLVRDLRTGQKSRPITPQSMVTPQSNCCPPAYPQPMYQPVYQPPIPMQPLVFQPAYPVPPTYVPNRQPMPLPWFDLGPNNVYAPSLYNSNRGYGVKLGSTEPSINSRWKATRLPK
jgi:hypothetical protein